MTTTKQMALCDNLNMNFDEASELFSSESLESMQIAQVNGGINPILKWVADAIVSSIAFYASVITISDYYKGTMGPTQSSNSDVDIKLPDGTMIKASYEQAGDTIKIGYNGNEMWVTISQATPTK